tara:strand:+ start:1956 stop:3770 length:1815 start_codon:yes stop_codon:yes gene_type:complete
MKKIITWLYILVYSLSTLAQEGISFYHLGSATLQSTGFNASYFPNGDFFVGLPILSGISLYSNNRFSYDDVVVKNGDINEINLDKLVSSMGTSNSFSMHGTISLAHLGFRTSSGLGLSLFANERIAADFIYPKRIANFLFKGNGDMVGEKINIGKVGASINYYREYGLGLAYELDSRLKVGARLKYLQGFVNLSTPHNFNATLKTNNENYQFEADWQNFQFRSAGISQFRDDATNDEDLTSYFISNGNRGFALDLGFEYKLNNDYAIAFAVNDIGYIGWKEHIETFGLSDTTFIYAGVELQGGDIIDSISLVADKFKADTTYEQYTSLLPANIIGSFVYTPSNGTDVIATLNARIIQGQINPGFGLGIRQTVSSSVVVSASITKLPQQFFNVGVGCAAKIGPVQLYMATDKILGYSVPSMKWAQVQLGMNLVFGNGGKSDSKLGVTQGSYGNGKGIKTYSFHGEKIEAKKYEDIYTIVPKLSDEMPDSYSKDKAYNKRFSKKQTFINSKSAKSNKVGKRFKPSPSSEGDKNQKWKKPKIKNSKSAKSNKIGKKFKPSPSSEGNKNQKGKKAKLKNFSSKWLSHENYTKQKKGKKSKPKKQKLKK